MIRVLIPVGQLPDGQVVTKRNGETPYTVKRAITIHKYGAGNVPDQLIRCEPNSVLLVAADGKIIAAAATMPMLAEMTFRQLHLLDKGEETT